MPPHVVADKLLRPEEPPHVPAEPPRRAPVPVDPALTRLPVLLDPVAMAPFLHRSLGPDAPFPAVRIRSLRYKPRTNLVVLYEVGLEGRSYEAIAMIAARRSLAHLAAKPQNVALARLVGGRSPAPMPLYYERELDALIQWFPLDLDLPTLAEPPGRLLEELQAAGLDLGVVDRDPAILAYKPRRQAVLSVGSHVLKLYAEREPFDRAAAGLRVAGGLRVIRTSSLEADLPARLLTAQKRLSGSPPARAAAVARDAGKLLRELHGASAPVAPPEAALQAGLKASPPSDQLAATEAWAKYVAALLPDLGGRLQELLRQIEAAVPRIDRLVLSHGDFTARQLLMSPDGLAAIDWDSMRLAPAAFDPAMFVARLVSREADGPDQAFEVLEELLEGYGSRPPGLAWYLATSIIGRSPEPFRYMDENWPERIEGMVTASEAALRLDGQPGSRRRSADLR